ncbi:MAG: bifunctional metallophosphatase/5'-nucleotidase [Flavobacteriaceae bacterium]|nr:bifunctional metallophosphatase/5'-nucleotidase [Flavobacteriaceae bacterium]
MKNILFLLVLTASLFFSCKENPENDIITFKFLQVNDVYEIEALNGGKFGGMARVAYVRDSIKKENPNTFLFMAGDFLNPSLLGTLKINGERIYGKHMIEVMNAMDFDLVTFGNHEFDLKDKYLQKRLNESNFQWMSSNVLHKVDGKSIPFTIQKENDTVAIPTSFTFQIKNKNGKEVKVGFVGTTIPSNPVPYVDYGDIYKDAKTAYNEIKDKVDVVMGFTHLEIDQDKELVRQIPEIPFVMGGHEHNFMLVTEGNSVIAKADANAKTLYIHTFTYNVKTKELTRDSELFYLDEKIAFDPKVEVIVDKWVEIQDSKITQVIDDPYELIYKSEQPLDGTDSANRSIQTDLGDIITEAMAWAYDNKVDAAIVNGGSIRIDDMLPKEVESIDIFRVLPFGGSVLKVDINGKLLKQVLDFGKSKRGNGAYLQRYNITEGPKGEWLIGGKKIRDLKKYTVAFSDFLLKGYDIPFLKPDNKGIKKVYTPTEEEHAYDIRKAIIMYLKSKK